MGFVKLLGYVDCFSPDLGSFQPSFFQMLFLSLSLSCSSGTVILHIYAQALFIFLYCFSYSVDNLSLSG